jgi:hypothetical protein
VSHADHVITSLERQLQPAYLSSLPSYHCLCSSNHDSAAMETHSSRLVVTRAFLARIGFQAICAVQVELYAIISSPP